jgi:hypothetical protein
MKKRGRQSFWGSVYATVPRPGGYVQRSALERGDVYPSRKMKKRKKKKK